MYPAEAINHATQGGLFVADLNSILGGGAGASLLILARLWVSRHVPRHNDEDQAPVQLGLKPDRFAFTAPERDLIFPTEERETLTPQLTAALWYANELRGKELVNEAARLLELGFDSPPLRALAGEHAITRRDLQEAADRAFSELEPTYPWNRSQAIRFLCKEIAQRVVDGKTAPHKAVISISRLNNWEFEGPFAQFARLNLKYEIMLEEDPIADFRDLDRQTRDACVAYVSLENTVAEATTNSESVQARN